MNLVLNYGINIKALTVFIAIIGMRGGGSKIATIFLLSKKVLRAIDAIYIARNPNFASNKIINYMPGKMDEWTRVVKPMCKGRLAGERGRRSRVKINIMTFRAYYNLMATLVHEAAHKKGRHNADYDEGECTNGNSCDQSYYDFRARYL